MMEDGGHGTNMSRNGSKTEESGSFSLVWSSRIFLVCHCVVEFSMMTGLQSVVDATKVSMALIW